MREISLSGLSTAFRLPRFKFRVATLVAPFLLAGTLNLHAQHHDRFYNGAREGQRGGYYGGDRGYHDDRRYDHRYDDHRYDDHQGGIGPGKGALIGGAGGAVLGALFGGGAKGALIGGGVGAGIGAIAGKAHQDNVRRRDDYYGR